MNSWLSCVKAAKQDLGLTGWVATGGSSEAGKQLLLLAREKYDLVKASKHMKTVKTMKTMKIMKRRKRKTTTRKPNKRRLTTKAMVLRGVLPKTKGGLKSEDLVKNSRGKIVSRKKSAGARSENLLRWQRAIALAKTKLNLQGFVKIAKGSQLYSTARLELDLALGGGSK